MDMTPEAPRYGPRNDGGVGVGGMATERLEAEITTLAADLTPALCRWLALVAEYDRRKAYEEWECVSMAQWLGVHVGIAAVTARQHVIVARRLTVLPRIRDAFAHGRISYSRVRALCRIATPEDEHRWLDIALRATASQLDRIVSDTIRAVNAADPDQAARHVEARRLTWHFDDDGMCHFNAILPPEIGTLLANLIKSERDDSRECTDEYPQRHADAFARLLHRLAGPEPAPAETPDPDPDPVSAEAPHPDSVSAETAVRGREAAPVLIVAHVREDCTAQLEGGPPISGELVDRLAVGAEYMTATHSEGAIRYGRRQRTPPPAMRRYLKNRDRCCQFNGCGATTGLHAHHIKEYVADNGETVPENIIFLCARHHGAIHRRGWTVTGNPETGTVVFRNPAGRPYVPNPPATTADPDRPAETNRQSGIRPDPDTITPKGYGHPYDHELTIWMLANAARPATTESR